MSKRDFHLLVDDILQSAIKIITPMFDFLQVDTLQKAAAAVTTTFTTENFAIP